MIPTLSSHPFSAKVGLGLRAVHYPYIEAVLPDVPWFEVLTDNYLCEGGGSLYHLEKICASYPITLHGVGMSLGSVDPLNKLYLQKLKKLIKLTQPLLVSDHLCWTSYNGHYFHELFPLPYTEEAISHVASRIREVQDTLKQQIMIENVSTYLQYSHSTLSEGEFLQAVAEQSDCLILLDINNIYVSATNNAFDPDSYFSALTSQRIAQYHLAGYIEQDNYLLDTHSAKVQPIVWKMLAKAIQHFGAKPTVVEWDNDIPSFQELQAEANKAQMIMENYAYIS